MIVILEPPRPDGFTSGGYRYQERVAQRADVQRRAVAPAALEETVAALHETAPESVVVVDGLFVTLRDAPLPEGVVALLHMIPEREAWCRAPLHVVATGAATARHVASASRSVALVRPGVDACFAPVAPRPDDGRVRIVCCGTVCDAKGQARLLRILRGIDAPWELTLLGAVTDEWREAADARVHVRGAAAIDDVARCHAESDLLVSLSRSESFGMAAAEAAAGGLPVLALDTGEIATFVDDGENGWLLPVDADDARIGNLLRELLTSPDALRQARGAPRPMPSWDAVADEFAAACHRAGERT